MKKRVPGKVHLSCLAGQRLKPPFGVNNATLSIGKQKLFETLKDSKTNMHDIDAALSWLTCDLSA